jgi:hypothetical protein
VAKKIEWTVRIIVHHNLQPCEHTAAKSNLNSRDAWWLGEALRYAGISSRLGTFSGPGEAQREVFELRCPEPSKTDTKVWAEQNASRLCSFGLDAAAAPSRAWS